MEEGTMKLRIAYICILLTSILLPAQETPIKQVETSPAIAMPTDRAADSYRIYSMLMPVGRARGSQTTAELLLVADTTTTMVQPDQPCNPPDNPATRVRNSFNPYFAVHPSPDQPNDYAELLQDFDQHCHDRIKLTADSFSLPVPLHVLTEAEQKEFRETRVGPRQLDKVDPAIIAKYKGARSLSSFSEVYFNAHHTVAMVFVRNWCGSLCGTGGWDFFSLKDGQWTRLFGWTSPGVIS
jgi:hypothetical protein